MRRFGPRVGNVSWQFRIGPNVFLRLFESLQVICKRYIPKLNGHKLRTVLVGLSACAGSGPEWAKFPGSLELAQTFSLDSLKACESFATTGHKLCAGLVGHSACAGSGLRVCRISLQFRIDLNFSFGLSASLRVVCKR